jgi:hypothetical protein
MKITKLFFAIWAVLGMAYFVWDTVQFEHRWSRNEGADYRILAGGPLVWTLYGSVCGFSLLVQYCSSSEVPLQIDRPCNSSERPSVNHTSAQVSSRQSSEYLPPTV